MKPSKSKVDNTEVLRMHHVFQHSVYKSDGATSKLSKQIFSDIAGGLSSTKPGAGGSFFTNVAAKLDFSGMDETATSDSSILRNFQSPECLKRKLLSTEMELQTSNAKLKERESFIGSMEPANKRICTNLEQKLEQRKKQNEIDEQKIEDLKGKLKCAQNEAAFARSQVLEFERLRNNDKMKSEGHLTTFHQEFSNLKIELAEVKSEKAETVRKLNYEIGKLELKLSMLNQEAEQSQDYIQTLKRQNGELTEKAAQWGTLQRELEEAQKTIKSLERKIEDEKEAAMVVHSMQSELKQLAEIEKENKTLKEENSKYRDNNVMLFQEKMWSFREKLMEVEKKNVSLAKFEVENERLKEKLKEWECLFGDEDTPLKSPMVFTRKLSDYQKNEVLLTNKLSQATSNCNVLEKQKSDLEEKITRLMSQLQQFQRNSPVQDTLIERLKRKVLMLSKERDNCRKLLDSYACETTMGGPSLNLEYIKHLEDTNAEYQKMLEKVEKDLDESRVRSKLLESSNKTAVLTSEMEKIRNESATLKTKIFELEQENEDLKTKFSQMDPPAKDSWKGKIMHMKLNPYDNAVKKHISDMKKLQEENDYLRKRVTVLEEEGNAASDVTLKTHEKLETEGAESTLKALREQLASSERQQRFILENARIKSTEFREAVYRLTGYRIDVPTAQKYKLSHVYADSRDEFLLFQVNSKGIQVIETDYSKQLTERMQLYLHQHDSFPAFLASITLDLFSQQTYMLS